MKKIKSLFKIFKILISPNFWNPFPTIMFTQSMFAINPLWAFRNALLLQVVLSRKKQRPRELGNFYEFGTFKGKSLIAFGHLKKLYSTFFPELKKTKMYSFDSFKGLPDSKLDHNDPVWQKGEFCGTLDEVKKNVSSYALRVEYVEGYYENSLNDELLEKMIQNPPSIIHIDVDIYSSTIAVLKWLDKLALPMSTYIFDDIWALGNHPDLGEQRAIAEYNSLSNTRGFLIESPLSLGSKTIYSFALRNPLEHSVYSQ